MAAALESISDQRSVPQPAVAKPDLSRDPACGGAAVGLVGQITTQLRQELSDRVPPEVIEACVRAECDRFRTARIMTFVPILVHRAARERLRALVPASW